jgi:glycosyltransferase involved in cell wall biosynthesis
MQKVSCIIAAYNEAPRIAGVLKATANHPLIDETIVVDDGSHDDTSKVASTFAGVHVITLQKNAGKSNAVCVGIDAARNENILLLDADLVGLTAEAISELINPVLGGTADISISLRKNSPWIFRQIGLDYISGERVLKKSFLASYLDTIRHLPGFGIETFMNQLIIKKNMRIKVVFLPNLISPRKYVKETIITGILEDIGMIRQIMKVTPASKLIPQMMQMRRQRV